MEEDRRTGIDGDQIRDGSVRITELNFQNTPQDGHTMILRPGTDSFESTLPGSISFDKIIISELILDNIPGGINTNIVMPIVVDNDGNIVMEA